MARELHSELEMREFQLSEEGILKALDLLWDNFATELLVGRTAYDDPSNEVSDKAMITLEFMVTHAKQYLSNIKSLRDVISEMARREDEGEDNAD